MKHTLAAAIGLPTADVEARGTGEQGPRLAPLYDLLSTLHWPALASRMAMRLGGAGTIDDLNLDAWKRFAESAGITFTLLRRRIQSVTTAITTHLTVTGVPDGQTARSLSDTTMLRAARIAQSI